MRDTMLTHSASSHSLKENIRWVGCCISGIQNHKYTNMQIHKYTNFFSCPEQLNRTHCLSVGRAPLTIREFTTLQSDPTRDLWPLRHLWQFLMTIFDNNFWWQFFYDNFLWQYLMTLKQFLTIGKTVLAAWHSRHWLQFWQLRTWIHDNHCLPVN